MIKKGIADRLSGKRNLAFDVDGFIFSSISILYLFLELFFKPNLYGEDSVDLDSELIIFLQLGGYFIYFTLSEYFFGNTIGKKIFGYKVVVRKKIKNKFWYFLLRTLIRLNPIDKFMYLMTGDDLLWHEKWTDIHTVKK